MSTSGAAPAPILTEAELKLLQALVYQECGMHFDERRTHFLQDRLLRRHVDLLGEEERQVARERGLDAVRPLVQKYSVAARGRPRVRRSG